VIVGLFDKAVDGDYEFIAGACSASPPESAPYRLPIGQAVEDNSRLHNHRVGTKYSRRVLGESALREAFSGRETRLMGTKMPRPSIQDDHPGNRVKDMDDEGTDVPKIPTSWLSVVGLASRGQFR
jgi:hypothetical protein